MERADSMEEEEAIILSLDEIRKLEDEDEDLLDYFKSMSEWEEEIAIDNMIVFYYVQTEILVRMEVGKQRSI